MQAPMSINPAITFATASPFLSNPSSLAGSHPALYRLQYNRQVGELSDVLVFAVPPDDGSKRDEIMQALKSLDSVLKVDVLEARPRKKRDEF